MLSESGQAYARTQVYYGRDVAEFVAHLEDDVLEYNVRAAFMVAMNRPEEPDESEKHLASMRSARESSERVRQMMAHG